MAPKLIVEVVGDTSQLERSFKRAERQTKTFTKDVERVGRGAAVATVGFRGLGRSVAFASGAFLGGAGIVTGIKSTIAAAEESQRVLGQVRVAVENSGLSWEKYRQQIEKASTATSKLSGFDDERLLQTFQLLIRRTGNVNRALELNALAADVARGRNIELEQAAQLVVKASLGQAGALRRVGIAAKQGATGLQLIDSLQRKFAGSAEAYGKTAAGAQDRFRVSVENLQEALGKGLLPALTNVLNFITDVWIPGMSRASEAVDNLAGKFGNLAEKIKHSSPLFEITGLQLGGAIVKGFKIALAMDGPGASKGGVLGQMLTTLVKGAVGELERVARQAVAGINKPGTSIAATSLGTDVTQKQTRLNVSAAQRNTIFDARIARALDRVQDIKTLRGQIARLREISALIQQRINITQDVTRKLNLGDQLAAINREILADQAQIADNAKAAADKLKAKEEAARKAEKAAQAASLKRATERVAAINKAARAQVERLAKLGTTLRNAQRAREQRQQFLALGLTATGEQRAPTRGNLQAQLRKVEAQIAGGPLDTKAMASRLSRVRKVLNDGFGKLTVDTRRAVAEFLDALAGKDQPGGPATKTQAASLKQLVAGTGLQGAGLRRLEFNLAGAHLTVPPRGGRTTVVHTSVNLDGRQVARNTTEHQERDQRRRAVQTRGRQRNK